MIGRCLRLLYHSEPTHLYIQRETGHTHTHTTKTKAQPDNGKPAYTNTRQNDQRRNDCLTVEYAVVKLRSTYGRPILFT